MIKANRGLLILFSLALSIYPSNSATILKKMAANYNTKLLKGYQIKTNEFNLVFDKTGKFVESKHKWPIIDEYSYRKVDSERVQYQKFPQSKMEISNSPVNFGDIGAIISMITSDSLIGEEMANGVNCYKVVVKDFAIGWKLLSMFYPLNFRGASAVLWINSKNYLLERVNVELVSMANKNKSNKYTLSFFDYKNIGGVEVPHQLLWTFADSSISLDESETKILKVTDPAQNPELAQKLLDAYKKIKGKDTVSLRGKKVVRSEDERKLKFKNIAFGATTMEQRIKRGMMNGNGGYLIKVSEVLKSSN